MKIYAVKNDKGEWYRTDTFGTTYWLAGIEDAQIYYKYARANATADRTGGHVVELIEAPAKVVVPKWFDEWLDAFHGLGPKVRTIAAVGRIAQQGWGSNANVPFLGDRTLDKAVTPTLSVAQLDYVHDNKEELMVAALTGNYTVEKPKRYVLPMEGTEVQTANGDEIQKFAWLNPKGKWVDMPLTSIVGAERDFTVTQSDIDSAPAWVKAITPVEVTDHD
ncbi:DUF1642 domain-containing protein [Lacticaseibacillus salsurivasis]|uniref:DUF1642 domain-containing protein n=1 Tax=Lacticaseibacillus salsurivasis TaxID=3081441 RepID=UPI0030C78395